LPEQLLLADKLDPFPLESFRREAFEAGFPGMPGFRFRGKTYFGALSENAWSAILKET